ncbi:NUDIX hydrolase domain-like [Phytophthora cactorum]|nr:NUDIX hydrolase domain-like [Phytophthora cactorum]
MTESSDHSSDATVVEPVLPPANKHCPTGMHKDPPDDGLTRLSSQLLQSRVGRDKQRYDGHTRLLACIVVSRRRLDASDEFLLISSSKHPTQWILPKGGWENDETVVESALREADEEAGVGVTGEIMGSLGTLDFASQQGKPCRFYGFRLQVTQVFEDWAENTRQRKWVSLDGARELLLYRPELVEMVGRAAAL